MRLIIGGIIGALIVWAVIGAKHEPARAEIPLMSPAATAYPLSAEDRRQRDQFDMVEASSGACMERAMHGLLLQGVTDRATIVRFAVTACGKGMKRALMSYGVTAAAADAYVEKSAADVWDMESR